MAKPTGFMEFERTTIKEENPLDRIEHFDEFKEPFPSQLRNEQAARCMDCGIPYCHSGVILNSMTSGCPLGNLIPEWNELVYKGLWLDALERLYKTNNFPEFTGRVCPAPCEGACTVGINLPPVTIKNIEYDIAQMAYSLGWIRPIIPENRTGKKVAIVGSGPCGLACAEQLNTAGHWVSVFERDDKAGGLLTYGIPNMKLDKGIVQKRINIMKASGISFITNTQVGVDFPVQELEKEFDAIILATGATNPRDLDVNGRNLKGVYFAMEYLTSNTKSLLNYDMKEDEKISARNKNVVVIGGGDTGTDCVGTAIRQGCSSVVQLEIMPKPPQNRPENNPWPQWPKTFKIDYGQEECIHKFGKDPRRFSSLTKELLSDENGCVKAVEVVSVEWKKGENDRYTPIEIHNSKETIVADLVLIAMGFLGPEQQILKKLGIEADNKTNIKANYSDFKTNKEKIFASGDARRGQSLVVWAIQEGREVAKKVDEFLMP